METPRNCKRKRLQSVDSVGGFDAAFVALPDELKCPICAVALRDPQQTICGHRFCNTCLEPLRKKKVSFACPVCRAELQSAQLFPDNAIKRHVMSLKAKCSAHKSGCEWQGELQQLGDHTDHCQLVVLSCSLGCGKKVSRRNMASHVKKCPQREDECQYCHGKFEHRHQKKHNSDCLQFPITCPQNCGEKLARCQKEDHVAADGTCPNTEIKCPFEDAGCSFVTERKDMGQHTKENLENHLAMSHMKVKELTKELTKEVRKTTELTKEVKELTKEVGKTTELTKEVREMKEALKKPKEKEPFHYLWKVNGWSVHLKNANDDKRYYICSEKVYVSVPGYRVEMMLYPNDSKSANNVGIYLRLVKGEYDDLIQWPFRLDYSFSLMDQQQDRQNKARKLVVDEHAESGYVFRFPELEGGLGAGCPNLISHEELQTRSFVKNDYLFVELTVYV